MLSGRYNELMNTRTIAQQLGRRGGLKRAARLSADRKRRIAALGGNARAESFTIARRIEENLRYAATLEELQPRPAVVTREERPERRLPGIYVR
jgi:hypothetical protein